jgi:quinol monooxygenase YgiN
MKRDRCDARSPATQGHWCCEHHRESRVEVQPEHLDAFRDVATQLAAASQDEPGTIQYRWFATGDPTAFVVIEEYIDEGTAFEHNQRCAQLLDEAGRVSTLTRIQIHGDLGPDLARWIDQNPQAYGFPTLGMR